MKKIEKQINQKLPELINWINIENVKEKDSILTGYLPINVDFLLLIYSYKF